MILQGADIVLGVTGGIACYKAVDLASKLVQAGACVDVIMTEAACKFVTPLPFQTITKRPVSVDMFQLLRETDMAHISLAARAEVLVIAPATANTIAKLAHGLADNLLTSTALATTAPLIIAPAMDADMWAHPMTQANVEALRRRGAVIVGPAEGRLASGRMGAGRLASTEEILGAIRQTLGRQGPLAGVRLVVTAGGTQEPLDPVRHLTNRSSGRMGYAVAEVARDYGAQVTLISAPAALPPVYGVEMVQVRTAADMHQAVMTHLPQTDVLIMAAAVADYRPASVAEHKIKKGEGGLVLTLERTVDILAAVAEARSTLGKPQIVVGFAAETENLLANARQKLEKKRLDLIVANDVSSSDSGFAVPDNRVTFLSSEGEPEPLPLMPKEEVAEQLLQRVAALWRKKHG
ncbi:MAG: bifunctional phosphopantothenoylcysteine decarboxylase/phosphopantothenate--cysteine ligase CoaBC [Chloroflexi bacterium]|nr:bifunctional phosphopantothenoylcysteine decarboxylase/phosphopantothenate--cysteine ligase CoaBC [Chloroflexota bacterium]